MPFENLNQREADDELEAIGEFSPKLLALAEQLGDDAGALAERYPPPEACNSVAFQFVADPCLMRGFGDSSQPQPRWMRRLVPRQHASLRWSIIAGAGAAAILCAVWIWQAAVMLRDRENDAAAPVAVVMVSDGFAQAPDKKEPRDLAGSEELRSPAEILRGLSAAEQEALLDLLEGNRELNESVSI